MLTRACLNAYSSLLKLNEMKLIEGNVYTIDGIEMVWDDGRFMCPEEWDAWYEAKEAAEKKAAKEAQEQAEEDEYEFSLSITDDERDIPKLPY